MGQRNIISFELRKRKDDDIKDALDLIPKQDRSEAIRAAIRVYISLGHTNIPGSPLKRPGGEIVAPQLENITLVKQEKSAEELSGALDDLLSDF